MEDKFDFGVNIDVSDIFHKTQAIRQAIELSAKQAFFASPTISEQFAQVGGQLQPMEYARPSFVRVMDPMAQQRENIISRTFGMLPPALGFGQGINYADAREEFRTQALDRTFVSGAAGLAMFGGAAAAWGILPGMMGRVAPSIFGRFGFAGAFNMAKWGYSGATKALGFGMLGGGIAGGIGGIAGLTLGLAPPMLATYGVSKFVDEIIEDAQANSATRNIGMQAISPTFSVAAGGRGLKRSQVHNLSSWVQDLAKKSKIKTPQMFGIAEFAAATGQFTGAQDVSDIKERIMSTLDTLSEIADESEASLEEVMGFARDINQMGFQFGAPTTSRFIKDIARAGRWSNMPGRQVLGMARMGAEMFRGTGIPTQYGATAMMQALPAITQMQDLGIVSPYLMSQLGGTPADLARTSLIRQQQFALSMPATVMMAGLRTMGPNAINQFNVGGIGLGQVLGQAGTIGGNVEQAAYFMMNQGRMFGQLDPQQVTQMQGQMVNQMLSTTGLRATPSMFQYAAMQLFPGQFRSPAEAELFFKEFTYGPRLRIAREGKEAIAEARSEADRISSLGYKVHDWWDQSMLKSIWHWGDEELIALGNVLKKGAGSAARVITRDIPSLWHTPELDVTFQDARELGRIFGVRGIVQPGDLSASPYQARISEAEKMLEMPGVAMAVSFHHSEDSHRGVMKYLEGTVINSKRREEIALGMEASLGLKLDKTVQDINGRSLDALNELRKSKVKQGKQLAVVGYRLLHPNVEPGMMGEEDVNFYSYMATAAALASEYEATKDEKTKGQLWEFLGRAKKIKPEIVKNHLTRDGVRFTYQAGMMDDVRKHLESYISVTEREEMLAAQYGFYKWSVDTGQPMDQSSYRIIQSLLGGNEVAEKDIESLLGDRTLPVAMQPIITAALKAPAGGRSEAAISAWVGTSAMLKEIEKEKKPATPIVIEGIETGLARALADQTLTVELNAKTIRALTKKTND